MAKVCWPPNVPFPFPSNTLTVLLARFATARSGFPSLFTSPTVTEYGALPVAKVAWVWNVPFPFPSNTLTVLLSRLATTRSGFPSPFTSHMVTKTGFDPVVKVAWVWKLADAFSAVSGFPARSLMLLLSARFRPNDPTPVMPPTVTVQTDELTAVTVVVVEATAPVLTNEKSATSTPVTPSLNVTV